VGFQLELIAHTGTSSTHNAEAQPTFTMILVQKRVDSRNRFRRDLNWRIFHKILVDVFILPNLDY
jgi:hypothetical protein